MAYIRRWIDLMADRRGITATEYAIMAGFIAPVVLLGATQVAGGITALWQAVMRCFP